MPQTLAVVRLQKWSTLPEDVVENTFAFAHTPAFDGTAATAIAAQLSAFYTAVGTGGSAAIQSWLGNSIQTTSGHEIVYYDITGHLDGSPHGAPIATAPLSITSTGATCLPDELAACVSFHGDYGTDVEFSGVTRPRARHRGRVYIGPLSTSAIVNASGTHAVNVTNQLCVDFAAAAGDLMGDPTYTWSVWSRARATLDVVVAGWVDNAFDVQRRRGIAPFARTTF